MGGLPLVPTTPGCVYIGLSMHFRSSCGACRLCTQEMHCSQILAGPSLVLWENWKPPVSAQTHRFEERMPNAEERTVMSPKLSACTFLGMSP